MHPSADWKETIGEGEAERFERFAIELRDMQRARAKKRGGAHTTDRALHAKGQLGLEAELTVLPDLPEPARVGMFAAPASYRAYVRFSNGAGDRQSDARPDVRGIAIKVVGVEGKKIIPGLENAKTQDFLLIKSPATPFRNADEFVALIRAASRPALVLPRVIGELGLVRALRILPRLVKSLGAPISSLALTRYFSALPIKYGRYAVHYALEPLTAPVGAKPCAAPEYLADDLGERLRNGPVAYDFRIQFYCDEARTPIEDGSVEWLEKDAPFVTVARLTLLKQDIRSPRGVRVAKLVEGFSFDPWHTTADFRPLGNMMRARNHAYRLSTQERGASPEPDGTETLD